MNIFKNYWYYFAQGLIPIVIALAFIGFIYAVSTFFVMKVLFGILCLAIGIPIFGYMWRDAMKETTAKEDKEDA